MLNRTCVLSAAALVMAAGASASGELIYAVTQDQKIVSWDSSDPTNILSARSIRGMQSNEIIQSIDYRGSNGLIYALGSYDRLYTIDPVNGQVTQVGPTFPMLIDGSNFGFDFNPVNDGLRVVSDTNDNYVLNADTGAFMQVVDLAYGAGDPNFGADPSVISSAYSPNVAGSTILYGIDTKLDILVTQNFSAGTLTTVGNLGLDVTALGGFDISSFSGIAYAVVQDVSQSKSDFVTIDLTTGQISQIGQVDGGLVITAMTVIPIPAPASAGVLLGLAPLAMRRRRR